MNRFSVAGRLALAGALTYVVAALEPVVAPAHAAPDRDINLVASTGFRSFWMADPRWATLPVGPDPNGTTGAIGQCGCAVTVYSMILENHFRPSLRGFATTRPWFPVHGLDPSTGGSLLLPFTFNPVYTNAFLRVGPPGKGWTPGSGFKASNACGLMVKPWALADAGSPAGLVVDGHFVPTTPSGITLDHIKGFDRDVVDARLERGLATAVIITVPGVGGHAELIVGWQSTPKPRYLIVDPAWRAPAAAEPYSLDDDTYQAWEDHISTTITYHFDAGNWLALLDDPAPISLLAVSPDGRRTGRSPLTGAALLEHDRGQLIEGGDWADPVGLVPAGDPAKIVAIRDPEPGTWRFQVNGTGNGAAPYQLVTVQAGRESVLTSSDGTIATGEARKYEVEYAPGTEASARQVGDFRPEARVEGRSQRSPGRRRRSTAASPSTSRAGSCPGAGPSVTVPRPSGPE